MSSYQKIKKRIFTILSEKSDSLTPNDIKKETYNIKTTIDSAGLDLAGTLLGIPNLKPLNTDDWERIIRELETQFDAKVELGFVIEGHDNVSRDNTWWSSKEKQNNRLYYWQRLNEYLKESLPENVVNTIDKDTDIIMNNIENPSVTAFNRKGMVVGHVQSGKTGNYSALMCKAADAGYKFIVIIAGGINNLRDQTQARINENFVGVTTSGQHVGVGIGNSDPKKLVYSLTTVERDFYKPDADRLSQGLNFDNCSTPILLVIKKNTHTLTNVISWLKNQNRNGVSEHAMLMIDDESDYATIDTSKEGNDPTTINRKLRDLLNIFQKSTYVAYTATPYANIFIDHQASHHKHGDDLFPKDFIYSLEAPSNYFGARKIFLDTDYKHLVALDDYLDDIPPKHKKDFDLYVIPESLYEAMRVFIINISIRNLRKQGDSHNSMLIHATRFTDVHKKFAAHVENYIGKTRKETEVFSKLHNAIELSKPIKLIKETFDLRFNNLEDIDQLGGWANVLSSIGDTIGSIVVREVHQEKTVDLEYRKDITTNAIVIGGTSLSRGYTLEGLSVSYFLRTTIYYDTLMQMGRWFGYRIGYEDLCKIYMPNTMIDNFSQIILSTEDLIDDFRRMSKENMTPYDFGLCVKHHPDSLLQVTARNKQQSTEDVYFEMKLDGTAKEASYISNDSAINNKNIIVIENILQTILSDKNFEKRGEHFLWRDIEKEVIIRFLREFNVFSLDPYGYKTKMPIEFIKKYVNEVDTRWDIAIFSGRGDEHKISADITIQKENRKVTNKGGYYELQNRQVAQGNADLIVLSDEDKIEVANIKKEAKDKGIKANAGKEIRARMKRPLLILHLLQTEEEPCLATFGISFPGGIRTRDRTVKIKVNSVWINEQLILETESDD